MEKYILRKNKTLITDIAYWRSTAVTNGVILMNMQSSFQPVIIRIIEPIYAFHRKPQLHKAADVFW